jgi:ribosomal protein L13
MLSKTEKKRLMRRLNIYNDQNHPHQAQNPTELDISNLHSTLQINFN